jgi:oligopeptidase B
MTAPTAKRVPHTWARPTGDAIDDYAWLQDRDDPDVISHLEAENAHTDAWFAPHADLVDALYEEIRSRVQETDDSPPVPHGGWWYARRTVEGLAYPIHCRGGSAADATEQVVLDENVEAEGHEFFSLGVLAMSPDHRLAAWSADTTGAERYTLRFRDVASGTDLDDVIEGTKWGGCAWSADGLHLLYVLPDAAERPHRVMRHELGRPQSADVEVFTEPDERFFVGVGTTRSREWVVISSQSKVSSEQRLLAAADVTAAPVLVAPRRDAVEYAVDHWGDRFVVLTNLEAEDFRVMTAPLDDPGSWTELIPHEPGRMVDGVEPFAGHLAVHEWVDAQPRIRVLFRGGGERVVDAVDAPHDITTAANRIYDTDVLRIAVESLVHPRRIVDVDVRTGEQVVLKQQPTPNVDLTAYAADRTWAVAEDGTRVPVDVVRHVDSPLDGRAPCLLYGYGAYEVSIPPYFSVTRLSLLDRGMTFALVHPRGGGEGGRRWYEQGKLLHKRTTFTDTLAAADHPFVDIVSTMSDPSLPLTVTEWEEWGDPREEPWASYMLSYSPYDNTVPAAYPAMYVTAGLNDPRVGYHEPAKWVARLRAVGTGDRPILLKTEMGAGHGGPSGRYEAWRDEARTLAFLLVALGVA